MSIDNLPFVIQAIEEQIFKLFDFYGRFTQSFDRSGIGKMLEKNIFYQIVRTLHITFL